MENNTFNVVVTPSEKCLEGEILIPKEMEDIYNKKGKDNIIAWRYPMLNGKIIKLKVIGLSDGSACHMNHSDMSQLGTEITIDVITLLIQ